MPSETSELSNTKINIAPTLIELARYFLSLGIAGFGGPPAHIAMMRADLVERKRWIALADFNDDLATANLLPGPTSTELTIYVGQRLHGVAGAIVAGVCFILPAFCIVLALSVLYLQWGQLPLLDRLLYGIKPVALALVMHGAVQLARPLLLSWREWLLLGSSLSIILFLSMDILVLFIVCGIAMVMLQNMSKGSGMSKIASWLPWPAFAQSASMSANLSTTISAGAVFWAFLKIGALIYGGGFALIGILQQELVQGNGWLTQPQLIDGIAIGQATPGPVFTTATFVGYVVAGWSGAILATLGIFAPAFIFVVLEHRLMGWLKRLPTVKVFLRGVNLAVVGSIVVACGPIGRAALVDLPALCVTLIALVALFRFKIAAHWLVLMGLLVGVVRLAIG